MNIVKKYEFDDFPDQIGHVELRSGEHDDTIVTCLNGKETVLVEACRDQWGLWLTILGGVEIAQEDKTRSFLDALIKCLMELRERNEYALPATKEH